MLGHRFNLQSIAGVKDQALPQLWHRSQWQLGSDSWPGKSICHRLTEKEKKKSDSQRTMSLGRTAFCEPHTIGPHDPGSGTFLKELMVDGFSSFYSLHDLNNICGGFL